MDSQPLSQAEPSAFAAELEDVPATRMATTTGTTPSDMAPRPYAGICNVGLRRSVQRSLLYLHRSLRLILFISLLRIIYALHPCIVADLSTARILSATTEAVRAVPCSNEIVELYRAYPTPVPTQQTGATGVSSITTSGYGVLHGGKPTVIH